MNDKNEYIKYYLNKNFFQFFEKEKIESYEKKYLIDYNNIFNGMPNQFKTN
jgi:hypothetical protein